MEFNSHVRNPTVLRKSMGKHKGRNNRERKKKYPCYFSLKQSTLYCYNEMQETVVYFIKKRSLYSLSFQRLDVQSFLRIILITFVGFKSIKYPKNYVNLSEVSTQSCNLITTYGIPLITFHITSKHKYIKPKILFHDSFVGTLKVSSSHTYQGPSYHPAAKDFPLQAL